MADDIKQIEETRDPDALKILERLDGKLPTDGIDDIQLPSDSLPSDGDDDVPPSDDDKLFANKYKTVEDLKKGVKAIGATLPDYVIYGMSTETLEQYYVDLQKDFSKGKDRKYSDKPTDATPPADDAPPSDKPTTVSPELWQELGETFNATGRITDEQYDKLEAVGIPSQVVDNYLDGLQAKAQEARNQIIAIAGDEESFQVMKKWAEENLDPEYINSIGNMPYNQMVNAIKGIKAQYDVANGTGAPRRIEGSTGQAATGAYRSKEEYLSDVRDPRYNRDKLFREKVDAKLSRSKISI